MACFTVTAAAAIGVGIARHIKKHQEKKNPEINYEDKLVNAKKLGYLELTMWGGSLLLAGEHAFHGEITYKFPFLTAVSEGAEATSEMLQEMGTIGVGMLAILVVAWFATVCILHFAKKKKTKQVTQE
ncbi:MAG: hypothetical protein J5617_00780 [Bacilli bacterium]|nr:hypothetical protein [Bacilli bacterium]